MRGDGGQPQLYIDEDELPGAFLAQQGIYTIEGDVVRVNSSCAEMADYRKLPVIEGTKSNIAGLAKAIMKR